MKFKTTIDKDAFSEYMYAYQNAFPEYRINQNCCYLVYGGEYFPKLINKASNQPNSYFFHNGTLDILSFTNKEEMLGWVEELNNVLLLKEL